MLNYPGEPLPVLISSPKRGHMISRMDGFTSVGSTGGRDYDRQNLFWGEEFDRRPTAAARLELMQRAIDVFPDLERAELVQQLAGSRPLSPDANPIIGPVPGREGVLLATGHTTKGIHLGPITGRIIADYIRDGSDASRLGYEPAPPRPIRGFRRRGRLYRTMGTLARRPGGGGVASDWVHGTKEAPICQMTPAKPPCRRWQYWTGR